ncbi:hypothetical protein SAMN05216379_1404 [Nitrosomonas eutropha]|uniref:hypothetical protein n=1 Tax=Nitrosomonas eutropha TaxID=916 RepID=UPI000887AE0E|nr:hypothetical protein [Nitrosomonas eutropha]SCX27769.1 hypothetical protein SAMN05216379_1404 [Nitrosomonas eutropha]
MRDLLCFRDASKSDLPNVLRLYSQPGMDDGKILSVFEAERIFERMSSYPNWSKYRIMKKLYINLYSPDGIVLAV